MAEQLHDRRSLRRRPARVAATLCVAAGLVLAEPASAEAARSATVAVPAGVEMPAAGTAAAPRAMGPPTGSAAPLFSPAVRLRGPAFVPELPQPPTGPLLALRDPHVRPPAVAPAADRPARADAQRRRAHMPEPAAAAPSAAGRAPSPAASAARTGTRQQPHTLAAAVARIPGNQAEGARWVARAYRGHWGATDWYRNTIYISPRTPPSRLYSVVAHEWSHLVQVRAYGGNVAAAVRAMTERFGGTGLTGAERAADCMALLQGATWTKYTACADPDWRRSAAVLLQGRRL